MRVCPGSCSSFLHRPTCPSLGWSLLRNKLGLGLYTPNLFSSAHMPFSFPVVFPQDLLEKGLEADNFAMLGLGDIVIPGEEGDKGGGAPVTRD